MTIISIGEDDTRATAPPDNTPCMTKAHTDVAPASVKATAALHKVPAVDNIVNKDAALTFHIADNVHHPETPACSRLSIIARSASMRRAIDRARTTTHIEAIIVS